MNLVERHIITEGNNQYKNIDKACFLSKNLYNSGLYHIKQKFIESGKWTRYNDLDRYFKETNNIDYRSLTTQCSQQILMLLDKNLKSYFQSIKAWKRDNKKFTGCPIFPKYKHKEKGRNVLIYTYQQVRVKDGFIHFPKKEGLKPLKTKCKKEEVKQVRVVPQSSCYIIEVVYSVSELVKEKQNNEWLGIDIGLNNLASCTNTKNKESFIINGKPLKSINQYYNKKISKIKSQLQKNHNKKSSKKTRKLILKRNNKIKDYIHKSSRYIVDYCVENKIDNIVLGKNDGWKQNIKIGKKNNQNFVNIPFDILEEQLKYKSKLVGINFTTIDEAYTSKCSALDLEKVCKHETYLGKRVKRGLFRTKEKIFLNADINASLNILRKVAKREDFILGFSRGSVIDPLKINL